MISGYGLNHNRMQFNTPDLGSGLSSISQEMEHMGGRITTLETSLGCYLNRYQRERSTLSQSEAVRSLRADEFTKYDLMLMGPSESYRHRFLSILAGDDQGTFHS